MFTIHYGLTISAHLATTSRILDRDGEQNLKSKLNQTTRRGLVIVEDIAL